MSKVIMYGEWMLKRPGSEDELEVSQIDARRAALLKEMGYEYIFNADHWETLDLFVRNNL